MIRPGVLALCLLPSVVVAHPGIDEVIHTLDREAALRAGDPSVALQQAAAHRIAGDFDAALDAIAHAEAHGGSTREVGLARADVFAAAGWLRSARRHLDRLIDANADDAEAHLRRARVLMRLAEPAAAARDYGRALDGASRPRPEYFVEHRDALVAAGDIAGALAALDAGIAHLGPAVSLELPAAALSLELGWADDALARIDRVLEQSPENPLLLARRGEVLMRAGRTTEARTTYGKALAALERRPTNRRSIRTHELQNQIRTALGEQSPNATEEAP